MRACDDDAVRYANEIYSFHDSDSTTGWVQPAAIPTTTTVLRRRSVLGAECDRRGTADDADQGGRERDDDCDDDCGTVIVVLPDAVKFIISVRLRGRSIKTYLERERRERLHVYVTQQKTLNLIQNQNQNHRLRLDAGSRDETGSRRDTREVV